MTALVRFSFPECPQLCRRVCALGVITNHELDASSRFVQLSRQERVGALGRGTGNSAFAFETGWDVDVEVRCLERAVVMVGSGLFPRDSSN